VRPPLEIGRAWHIAVPLDPNLLKRAARLFMGRHDFGFFLRKSRKRRAKVPFAPSIMSALQGRRGLIEIEIAADGFLYKMVRLMVGSIARCALGKESLQSVEMRLERPSRPSARFVAPAAGLYLIRVYYLSFGNEVAKPQT
jgi:tRNA pseudouridine38-40 synthase